MRLWTGMAHLCMSKEFKVAVFRHDLNRDFRFDTCVFEIGVEKEKITEAQSCLSLRFFTSWKFCKLKILQWSSCDVIVEFDWTFVSFFMISNFWDSSSRCVCVFHCISCANHGECEPKDLVCIRVCGCISFCIRACGLLISSDCQCFMVCNLLQDLDHFHGFSVFLFSRDEAFRLL